jgi:hypothetical protein
MSAEIVGCYQRGLHSGSDIHSGFACDQCFQGCGVKPGLGWTGFLAGEGLEDRTGAIVPALTGHWLEAASGQHRPAVRTVPQSDGRSAIVSEDFRGPAGFGAGCPAPAIAALVSIAFQLVSS